MRALSLALALAAVLGIADAAADEPFYKGKRLTILINFAAGGPTDIEARLFAKHLVRHVDGAPNIVIQNMDGAGGIVGAKYLGEVAPRDGTMAGYFTGTAFMYALDPERFRVDFKTYEFVATQAGTTVHFVRTDVAPGMKEATDIVKAKGLIVGGLSVDTPKDLRLRLAHGHAGHPVQIRHRLSLEPGGAAGVPARRDQFLLGIAAELPRHGRAQHGEDRAGDPDVLRRRLRRQKLLRAGRR